jgi:hypothetical protein
MTSKLNTIVALILTLFLFSVSAFACAATGSGIKVEGFSG